MPIKPSIATRTVPTTLGCSGSLPTRTIPAPVVCATGSTGAMELLATVDFTTMTPQTINNVSGSGTIAGGTINYGHTTGGTRGLVIDATGLYTSGSGFANRLRLNYQDMCGVDFSGTTAQPAIGIEFTAAVDPNGWGFYFGSGTTAALGSDYAVCFTLNPTQVQWARSSTAHGYQNSTSTTASPRTGFFMFGDPGSPRFTTGAIPNPPLPWTTYNGYGRSVISDSKLFSSGPGCTQFYWDGNAANANLKIKRLYFWRCSD